MTKIQNKNFFVSILFILALSVAACEQAIQDGTIKEINNFEDCAKAGYPVYFSEPPFCETPDGRTFTKDMTINSFEDCAKAGYPVGESYPRQCFAPDKTFVEEIESKEPETTIETGKGELKLAYKDNKSILSGTLKRSTPCVNWTVQIGGTKDLPRSQVAIDIFDRNKGVICIQMLGEPQEIYEEIISVSEETEYTVKIEQEVVFEGKLNG